MQPLHDPGITCKQALLMTQQSVDKKKGSSKLLFLQFGAVLFAVFAYTIFGDYQRIAHTDTRLFVFSTAFYLVWVQLCGKSFMSLEKQPIAKALQGTIAAFSLLK